MHQSCVEHCRRYQLAESARYESGPLVRRNESNRYDLERVHWAPRPGKDSPGAGVVPTGVYPTNPEATNPTKLPPEPIIATTRTQYLASHPLGQPSTGQLADARENRVATSAVGSFRNSRPLVEHLAAPADVLDSIMKSNDDAVQLRRSFEKTDETVIRYDTNAPMIVG